MMEENDKTDILYKYISWNNEYQKRILTENKIFFSSASKFNDPFDCSIDIQFEDLTDEEALEDIKGSIKEGNPTLNPDEIEKKALEIQRKGSYRSRDNISRTRKIHSEAMYEDFGIFSLSEHNANILMWSHYSDSHKGICIGFNVSKLDEYLQKCFNKNQVFRRKVKYQPYPCLKINERNHEYINEELITKAPDWQYEDEWRIILGLRTNKEVQIPKEIITQVIMGCRISFEHRIEIIELLRDWDVKPKLFQAEPCKNNFSLDVSREIQYFYPGW